MTEIHEKITDFCLVIHRTAENTFGKANITIWQYLRLRHELFLDVLRRLIQSWIKTHNKVYEEYARLENESS